MPKRKTTEQFKIEVSRKHPSISVIGEYVNGKTAMEFLCNVCGTKWNDLPHYILHTSLGCPECNQKYVHVGQNDFATMAPHLLCFFEDPAYATKITYMSHKQVSLICPVCGVKRSMSAFDLYRNGFHCQCCDDGVSYPNRVIRNVIRMFNVDNLKFEYYNDWTNGRFYDVYFELNDKRYVIEMDGAQHMVNSKHSIWSPAENIHTIDEEKDLLALKNNVQMIRIDCRQSRFSYIKNNIEHSLLSHILDLSLVDWEECDKRSQSSLIVDVCDFYNQNPLVELPHIAVHFGLAISTVRAYLYKGTELGICCYHKRSRGKIPVTASNPTTLEEYSFDTIRKCCIFLKKLTGKPYGQQQIEVACVSGELYNDFYFQYA